MRDDPADNIYVGGIMQVEKKIEDLGNTQREMLEMQVRSLNSRKFEARQLASNIWLNRETRAMESTPCPAIINTIPSLHPRPATSKYKA
jgi:hypothetical protein